MAVLTTKDLVKVYNKRKVVDGVNLELNSGEIIGLLGPNGAGKTTTFYMTVGLIKPETGQVFLDGQDITGQPMFKRARLGVGYLAQEPSIFRKLTVEENIMAVLEFLPISRAERKSKLDQLLKELNLTCLAKQPAYLLSGGEKRKVEITRSLATAPSFLLLDEPFVGIDPLTLTDLQDIVLKLKKRGLGILITDHRVRETLEIIDRAYIIYNGKILHSGTAHELLANEDVRRLYLGDKFKM